MVPVTLLHPRLGRGHVYKNSQGHKFSATVTSFQDDAFYPMDVVSPNEVAIFEAFIKRGVTEDNETPDEGNSISLLDVSNCSSRLKIYVSFFIKVFQSSMGPTWVGSSAVFLALVSVPPGKSWFTSKLNCPDEEIATHYSSFILEDRILGGPIGYVAPHWTLRNHKNQKTITNYKVIENFGFGNATVPVAAVVRAVKEGNATCTLRIGDEDEFSINTDLHINVVPLLNSVRY